MPVSRNTRCSLLNTRFIMINKEIIWKTTSCHPKSFLNTIRTASTILEKSNLPPLRITKPSSPFPQPQPPLTSHLPCHTGHTCDPDDTGAGVNTRGCRELEAGGPGQLGQRTAAAAAPEEPPRRDALRISPSPPLPLPPPAPRRSRRALYAAAELACQAGMRGRRRCDRNF